MATRWGICGAGKISHDFTVAMKTLPPGNHQIVAVAARSLEHAEEFAKRHGISKAYGSYEELAKDPGIDIIYLGVLHTQHLRVGLLFLNAKRSVLCEKPFAMNSKEVKQLISAARENDVFLMEGIWSRCFPVHVEVCRLLSEGTVGEVKVVKAYFGSPQLHIPRAVERELGGGALLDIGVYCLQFVLMVFRGERPESIHATGVLLDTGVDETMAVVLKFSRNRMALCCFSIAAALPNDATISGTKGTIRIPSPMWCPTHLVVNGKEREYPLPEPSLPLNFTNSTGLRYEAEEVRQCLLKGLKESSQMSLADSSLLTEIMDEARRQVGVVFPQDSP
ncbi:trans-1,2-dihydrobenzene-1,2-diol dehydrogenase-like [Megalops cyprinoides]|uniref:trans-1,2-dihydrobenzene-1,2-diol dehydrogenase-like n=1 Tax=Megalops cyprinoides TaxID=118141 RepID=UPI00186552FD|nr:trans-1,2-dihydrobenzene-1,2-diol dehydrogenase-like [Megalops cyprinoides]